MSLPRRTFCLSALAAAVASAIPPSTAPAVTLPAIAANRRFSVLYAGDRIGRHVVRSTPLVEGIRVNTEVDMTVKKFFVTLFSYHHRSEEVWRDGRLMTLTSETTEDGVTFPAPSILRSAPGCAFMYAATWKAMLSRIHGG